MDIERRFADLESAIAQLSSRHRVLTTAVVLSATGQLTESALRFSQEHLTAQLLYSALPDQSIAAINEEIDLLIGLLFDPGQPEAPAR